MTVRSLFLITVTLGLMSVNSSYAQNGQRQLNVELGAGINHLSVSDFNALLATNLPRTSNQAHDLAGGLHLAQGRIIVGLLGTAFVTSMGESADHRYKTRLSGSQLLLDMGYVLYNGPSLKVYPIISVGGGAVAYSITRTGRNTFSAVVTNPEQSSILSSTSVNGAFGGQAIRAFRARGRHAFTFSARGMYVQALHRSIWHENETAAISGGPELGMSGWHFLISAGVVHW